MNTLPEFDCSDDQIESMRDVAQRLAKRNRPSTFTQAKLLGRFIDRENRAGKNYIKSFGEASWIRFADGRTSTPRDLDLLKAAWDWMSEDFRATLFSAYEARKDQAHIQDRDKLKVSDLAKLIEKGSNLTVDEWSSGVGRRSVEGKSTFYIISRYLYDPSLVSVAEASIIKNDTKIQVVIRWPYNKLSENAGLHYSSGEIVDFFLGSVIIGGETLHGKPIILYLNTPHSGYISRTGTTEGVIVRKMDSGKTICQPCCLTSFVKPQSISLYTREYFTSDHKQGYLIENMLSKEPLII